MKTNESPGTLAGVTGAVASHNGSNSQKNTTTDTIIATIQKNRREQFQIALRDFKGHRFVDLRVYANNGQEIVPTAKGITIKPELLTRVIEALRQAETEAQREGLLDG